MTLVSFRVGNFLSINEPIDIMFIPSDDQSHPEQLTNDGFLKTAALFGANASGKTNITLSFDYLKYLVTGEHSELIPYKLKGRLNGDVSCFASSNTNTHFELYHTGNFNYHYTLDFDSFNNKVIFEKLSRVQPDGKDVPLFTREKTHITLDSHLEDVDNIFNAIKSFNDESKPLISLKNENERPLFYFLSTYREIESFNILSSSDYDSFDLIIEKAHQALDTLLKCLADTTDVTGYQLVKKPNLPDGDPIAFECDSFIKYSRSHMIVIKMNTDGSTEVSEVCFCIGDTQTFLELNQLSSGVLRIIDIVMRILSTTPNSLLEKAINRISEITSEKQSGIHFASYLRPVSMIYIYDEICYALHPSIVNKLLKNLFEIDRTAQFVITLHETEIMSKEVLRPDEFWLVNKKKNTTFLESLDSYELPSGDLKSDYLNNRFEGIPRFRKVVH
ncbi:RloA-like protein [methanogenic archaeon mixed culture ISO4-G1]|nr:RloA-like protein [methanogenic archaeon mixed culture ISO4-G1]